MSRRFHVLACAVLFGGLAWQFFPRSEGPKAAVAEPAASVPALPERPEAKAEIARDTEARIQALASLEAESRKRAELSARAHESRVRLQLDRSAAWSALIRSNWPAFQALRESAGKASNHRANCTICSGTAVLNLCIVCNGTGACITCGGSGKVAFNETCATCESKGKCYFCSGTGKMACPFCDNGTISLAFPFPPTQMPLEHGTTLRAIPAELLAAAPPATNAKPSAAAPEATPVAAGVSHAPALAKPNRYPTIIMIALIAVAVWALRKQAAKRLRGIPEKWESVPAPKDNLGEFAGSFQHGLEATLAEGVLPEADPPPSTTQKPAGLEDFHAGAARDLRFIRGFFSEIACGSAPSRRTEMLNALVWQVGLLKLKANRTELFPIWQVACALQGLLSQLAQKAENMTPMALQTAFSAVELLEELCEPSGNFDFAGDSAMRVLAVDDDAVSREVISASLKKVFKDPELASDSTAALELIQRRAYDVIFLDVDMPGVSGLELCSIIHEQAANRKTPVVFVTGSSGAEAQAKTICVGGQDLIAKPFLAFEIALKALTLAFRRRLPSWAAKGPSQSSSKAEAVPSVSNRQQHDADPSPKEFADAFFSQVREQIQAMRAQLGVLLQNPDAAARQDAIGDFYVQVDALMTEADRAELRSAFRLCSGIHGLLRKMLSDPRHTTDSTLNTVIAALRLLEELCETRQEPSLADPPVRILVVDDDAVIRRGISGVLQSTFGKTESAANGEEAVALAGQQSFDVIFMDVMMPGMDGFEACAKVHQTTFNRLTPVIFVTSRTDKECYGQFAVSGGSGLIPKPVLSIEITLTALTFAFRNRLAKAGAGDDSGETPGTGPAVSEVELAAS